MSARRHRLSARPRRRGRELLALAHRRHLRDRARLCDVAVGGGGHGVLDGAVLVRPNRRVGAVPRPPLEREAGDDRHECDNRGRALGRLAARAGEHLGHVAARHPHDQVEDAADRDDQCRDRQHFDADAGNVARVRLTRQLMPLHSHAVDRRAEDARQRDDRQQHRQRQQRDDGDRPRRHDDPGPQLELARLGPAEPARQEAAQRRADAMEEVRDAGDVRQQVVAVEPHERRQLPDHLQDLGRDDEQQPVPPDHEPPGEHRQRDERVEVEAAEVGADPRAPAEPVAVGDVGVERGVDEVEAGAHCTGGPTTAAQGRGVTELVESRGHHRDREHREQQPRSLERLVRRRSQALLEQHPPRHRSKCECADDDEQRREQQRERRSETPGHLGLRHDELRPQRQQRAALRQRRMGSVTT